MPVSFDEVALGAEIKIPTLGGAPVTLKIPAGTPNGRTFRVRGRGAAKKDGTQGRPARHRRRSRSRHGSTTPPARRSRRYRARAAVDGTLRANLFEQVES